MHLDEGLGTSAVRNSRSCSTSSSVQRANGTYHVLHPQPVLTLLVLLLEPLVFENSYVIVGSIQTSAATVFPPIPGSRHGCKLISRPCPRCLRCRTVSVSTTPLAYSLALTLPQHVPSPPLSAFPVSFFPSHSHMLIITTTSFYHRPCIFCVARPATEKKRIDGRSRSVGAEHPLFLASLGSKLGTCTSQISPGTSAPGYFAQKSRYSETPLVCNSH